MKEVHVLPVDDRYPDCVFVEDPVVVCGDTAFLPILGKYWWGEEYKLKHNDIHSDIHVGIN